MATVLIVDDAKIIRKGIRNIMENLGHTIIAEADNGFDGIEKYKECQPDIVTMDITMPNVNGIDSGVDAVKHIIDFDEDANIIMVTAHGEQDKVMKSIENGALGYVLKPITGDKLRTAIKKLGF
jgi:two-component system chemotaxis response regulator CheY